MNTQQSPRPSHRTEDEEEPGQEGLRETGDESKTFPQERRKKD